MALVNFIQSEDRSVARAHEGVLAPGDVSNAIAEGGASSITVQIEYEDAPFPVWVEGSNMEGQAAAWHVLKEPNGAPLRITSPGLYVIAARPRSIRFNAPDGEGGKARIMVEAARAKWAR